MPKITIYTKASCPFCVAAKSLIEQRGYPYEEIPIDADPAQRERMIQRAKRHTVPQIFIGDRHIGGYDDLSALDRQGGFVALMEQGDD